MSTMRNGVSLHLDLIRFSAALVVFLGHAGGRAFTGGLFWELGGYLQTAVMIFFVMSGYVIAHVLTEREQSVSSYATSRLARLYSIVIPALVLTAICDAIGLQINSSFYFNGPWGYPSDGAVLRYLATFTLTNEFWFFGHPMEPGINVPFWSLSFEATYYIIAGCIFFSKGITRYILCGAALVTAGPSISALWGVWLMGFMLYRFQDRMPTSNIVGLFAAVIGAGLLAASPIVRQHYLLTLPFVERKSLVGDYFDGIAFAIHLCGIQMASRRFEITLFPFTRIIRWLGSLTFALYLFHRPVMQLLAVVPIAAPASWPQRMYLLAGTFLVVTSVGRWCESKKGRLKFILLQSLSTLANCRIGT